MDSQSTSHITIANWDFFSTSMKSLAMWIGLAQQVENIPSSIFWGDWVNSLGALEHTISSIGFFALWSGQKNKKRQNIQRNVQYYRKEHTCWLNDKKRVDSKKYSDFQRVVSLILWKELSGILFYLLLFYPTHISLFINSLWIELRDYFFYLDIGNGIHSFFRSFYGFFTVFCGFTISL